MQKQANPRAGIRAVSKEKTSVERTLLLIDGIVLGIAAIAVVGGPVGPTSYEF